MQKRHFIALADVIRDFNAVGPQCFDPAHIECIADFCQSQNPRFDRNRWLGYIAGTNGANGGKVKG